MKIYLTLLIIFGSIIAAIVFILFHNKSESASQKSLVWFKKEINVFGATATDLKESVSHINPKNSGSANGAKKSFKRCRMQYKRISFFMEYFFLKKPEFAMGRRFRRPKTNK